jgi:hypothetical protein
MTTSKRDGARGTRTTNKRKQRSATTRKAVKFDRGKRLRAMPGMLQTIAKRLRINKQATSKWRRVPAERLHAVARISGLTPTDLRADLYPPADTADGHQPILQP